MRDLLDRFTLDAIKFDYQVLAALLVIWFFVVGCAIHSVFSQRTKRSSRVAWSLFLIFCPIIGVLFYLPFSFRLENYPDLFIWRKSTGGKGKK
jgi:uncharacterized membrane protein YoaK (UPF0700 family)